MTDVRVDGSGLASPLPHRSPRFKIPLVKPLLDEEMKEAAVHALQNEMFVQGESVNKFEEEFASYSGTDFAVSTASGTAALTLSLISVGVREYECLTTPLSFVGTANSIIHAGATSRFSDVELQTYNIDPLKISGSINEKTKVVMPVHLYGFPAEMDEICEIAERHRIFVVEDACQAHGASYGGKKTGSLGDVGCFSFYPSKNMTVGGDGGMVVTNDESIAESVRSLRDAGRARGSRYIHTMVGFTARLNTVQAAIGRVQLKRLDEWNKRRRRVAETYDTMLSDLEDVVTPPTGNSVVRPAYHMYVIRSKHRTDLQAWLKNAGIETGIHYPEPIHLQPIHREMFGWKRGEFPNSEAICKDVLSIPMHPTLTSSEVKFVCETIHEFYSKNTQTGWKT